MKDKQRYRKNHLLLNHLRFHVVDYMIGDFTNDPYDTNMTHQQDASQPGIYWDVAQWVIAKGGQRPTLEGNPA